MGRAPWGKVAGRGGDPSPPAMWAPTGLWILSLIPSEVIGWCDLLRFLILKFQDPKVSPISHSCVFLS